MPEGKRINVWIRKTRAQDMIGCGRSIILNVKLQLSKRNKVQVG